MAAPALAYQTQGAAVVSADNFNTFEQTCDTIAQLRAFPGISGLQVFVASYANPNDGGAGPFRWNSTATAADDGGITTVVCPGVPGAWLRLGFLNPAAATLYNAPITGFSLTVTAGYGQVILNPAGTLAAGTIVFPAAPVDSQILRISSTQIITALSLSSTKVIKNPLTSIAAGGAAGWQFLVTPNAWFRIQ